MERKVLPDASLTLLTGATGALGQEVLCQWLENASGQEHLLVLARGKGKGGPERRIRSILRKRFSPTALAEIEQRLTVLNGDVTEERLGLEPELYQEVAARTAHVVHCAAAVRFDQPLPEAREINLEGTRRMLDLARTARKAGQNVRFDHVSTAYIAGKRQGMIYEHEFQHKKGFHNTYEQSKYEAEILVQQAMNELPATIYRPSIIIGNSRTGETSNFKAFYWPVRVYAMGQLHFLPGISSCRIDLVPVDYVAAALLYMGKQKKTLSGTYHLTAGPDNLLTLGEIVEATVEFFKIKRPRLVHPVAVNLIKGRLGRHFIGERALKTILLGEPYYPYFATNLTYDNRQVTSLLENTAIKAPHVRDFFDRLFRFCVDTDWGRRSPEGAGNEESPDKDLVHSI